MGPSTNVSSQGRNQALGEILASISRIVLMFLCVAVLPVIVPAQVQDPCASDYHTGICGMCLSRRIRTSRVSGQVLGADGIPIPGYASCIRLLRRDWRTIVATAQADDLGRFHFRHVRAGNYLLVVQSPGWMWSPVEVHVVTSKRKNMRVSIKYRMLVPGVY